MPLPDDKPSSSVLNLRPVSPNDAGDEPPESRKSAAQIAAEQRAEQRARAREEARAAARARAAEIKTPPVTKADAPKPAPTKAAPSPAAKTAPLKSTPAKPASSPAGPSKPPQAGQAGKTGLTKPSSRALKPAPSPKPPAKPAAKAKPPVPAAAPKPPAKPAAKAPPKKAAPKKDPAAIEATEMPPARPSEPKPRHRAVFAGLILVVILPLIAAAWYLWARATDQYVSELGFTVRQEETATPTDILGGLTSFSSSGSSDTDVLYEYIQSQELVQIIDETLDLRTRFSVSYDTDPVFGFDPEGSIEDLVSFWRRQVQISYDPGSGMMELSVFAFDPRQAQEIAEEIVKESSRVINEISAVAREDATRYARGDLQAAQDDLRSAREALTAFRSRTRIIDPSADLQGQMGLLTTLQQQLAAAMIELDLLRETTSDSDTRVARAMRRIEVIENRIEEERSKFGQGGVVSGAGGQDYATLVAEFERLTVEREFAEQTYIGALSAFASAKAEAERQSRYLAPYIRPTLAETARHPQRLILFGLTALFLTLVWAISVLIYYSLRDRQ